MQRYNPEPKIKEINELLAGKMRCKEKITLSKTIQTFIHAISDIPSEDDIFSGACSVLPNYEWLYKNAAPLQRIIKEYLGETHSLFKQIEKIIQLMDKSRDALASSLRNQDTSRVRQHIIATPYHEEKSKANALYCFAAQEDDIALIKLLSLLGLDPSTAESKELSYQQRTRTPRDMIHGYKPKTLDALAQAEETFKKQKMADHKSDRTSYYLTEPSRSENPSSALESKKADDITLEFNTFTKSIPFLDTIKTAQIEGTILSRLFIQKHKTPDFDPTTVRDAEEKLTLLHIAAIINSTALAQAIIETTPETQLKQFLEEKDIYGETAIFDVTSPEMFDLLTKAGANIHATNSAGKTALDKLIAFDQIRVLEKEKPIIAIMPKEKIQKELNAFARSAISFDEDEDEDAETLKPEKEFINQQVQLWIDCLKQPEFDVTELEYEEEGITLLHMAVMINSTSLAKAIISSIPDQSKLKLFLEKTNKNKETAMFEVISPEMAILLVEAGAKMDAVDPTDPDKTVFDVLTKRGYHKERSNWLITDELIRLIQEKVQEKVQDVDASTDEEVEELEELEEVDASTDDDDDIYEPAPDATSAEPKPAIAAVAAGPTTVVAPEPATVVAPEPATRELRTITSAQKIIDKIKQNNSLSLQETTDYLETLEIKKNLNKPSMRNTIILRLLVNQDLLNNLMLTALYYVLLEKEFDYLRKFNGLSGTSGYIDHDKNGRSVTTTKTWGLILKALTNKWYENIFKEMFLASRGEKTEQKAIKPRCIDAPKDQWLGGISFDKINSTAAAFKSSRNRDHLRNHLLGKKQQILDVAGIPMHQWSQKKRK